MKNVFRHRLTSFLFCSFLFTPFCQAENAVNGPDRFRVGIGFKSESSHFIGVENETMVIPRVDIKYAGFYWRGPKLGYRVIENKNFEIAAVLRPFEGFEVNSADIRKGYKGINEREGDIQYGFNASFSLGNFKAGITPLWSAEGNNLELSLKYKIIGESYIIKPEITYQRYDDDSMNYYFGITAKEANDPLSYLIDSPYTAKSNGTFGLKVIGAYLLSENWFVMGRLSYDKFGSDVLDSPIVNSASTASFALGVGYNF
ncbi:MipA/OmpV family protein [Pseudoalteromonas denitrificans]|jgi:outer membrane protein|uniref:Outer membrane scaffolding protein for murein synthesis, MipA/OmpV family n=1 Tax=Pseudoalteromonas denitrificans DSM 6059 TaxID=1123010 RepID=A0A1I1SYM7_9GAMM|nr:MipA/OmpV family protein [Pseudoalteromonas denitrificans]SFD51559.1 Outer membrane scaffolding protein for murein synthesis, MipA/OmpV family [Pseudoalteromonas denitrificans DSM 6059]